VDVPARVAAGQGRRRCADFLRTRVAYSVSGAVFDHSGAGLEDVLILFANDKGEIVALPARDPMAPLKNPA